MEWKIVFFFSFSLCFKLERKGKFAKKFPFVLQQIFYYFRFEKLITSFLEFCTQQLSKQTSFPIHSIPCNLLSLIFSIDGFEWLFALQRGFSLRLERFPGNNFKFMYCNNSMFVICVDRGCCIDWLSSFPSLLYVFLQPRSVNKLRLQFVLYISTKFKIY